ncbi:hypothetical protein [Rhodoferax ferrireducens]|uniref:hypothetical protein n=1 Tax=Rhodoferax ferrireducens TaxID=192843 RepID=UPI003BB62C4C
MMATLPVALFAATHAQAEENEGGFRGFFKDDLHGKSSSQNRVADQVLTPFHIQKEIP